MREQESTSSAVWHKWFLDAISKIRSQKQRPSADRICHAIRQHHQFSEDIIKEQLEKSVAEKAILKVLNKGICSYKDPDCNQTRNVHVSKDSDLTRIVYKAIKELNEPKGSTLKSIEKYVQHSNALDLESDLDLTSLIKTTLKRAIEKNIVIQEGKVFKINSKINFYQLKLLEKGSRSSDSDDPVGRRSYRSSSEDHDDGRRKSRGKRSPSKLSESDSPKVSSFWFFFISLPPE